MLQFIPTSEGYYDFVKNLYIYNYVDHLGNVRLSYADSNKNGVIEPSTEIIEENNYYPFGLKHSGYNNLAGNPKYQYKYQGQELQETGFYSFKWRNYMPDVGRFFNVDPLSEKYAYQSPYNFSENRVINARELEGLESWIVNGREQTSAMSSSTKFGRTLGFSIAHPIVASHIGLMSGETTISGVSARFANKIGAVSGADNNAIRHGLWSAMINQEFGTQLGLKATNAHEGVGIAETQSVDMSKTFSGKGTEGQNLADHIVDVLNNSIGAKIAESNPDASVQDLAKQVLGEFKNNGMWTVTTDKDGNVSISKTKISKSQYNASVKAVDSLNSNGYTQEEQSQLIKEKTDRINRNRGPKL